MTMPSALRCTRQSTPRLFQRQTTRRLARSSTLRHVPSFSASFHPAQLVPASKNFSCLAVSRDRETIRSDHASRPRPRSFATTSLRPKTSTIEGTIESGAADTSTPATSTTISPSSASESDTPDPFTTAVPSSTSPSSSSSPSASPSTSTSTSTASSPSTPLPTPEHLNAAEAAIFTKLAAALEPVRLEVQDISGGCGSMYGIEIVSARFRGLSVLKQQRLVNAVLAEEIKGWHGVQLKTRVP